MRIVTIILLICLTPFCLFPQDSGGETEQEDGANEERYEPYQEDEFPPLLHQFRRSEVLFFGSFPLSYLYSNLGYFAYSEMTGHSLDANTKNQVLLYTSLSISLTVVLIDLILDYINGK